MTEINETLIERGKTHGDYILQSRLSQAIKYLMKETPNYKANLSPQMREALDMIAVKISRICTGNSHEEDHWHDIAGYAELAKKSINRHDNG